MDRFDEFINGCKSQWVGGGKRYALEEDKEYTDLVCETAGNIWIGGNIIKYAGEIHNARDRMEPLPEVDFFKIAVYSFIWWLKEFKHPITGVRLKEKYWGTFVKGFNKTRISQNRIRYGGQPEHLFSFNHYQDYIDMVARIKLVGFTDIHNNIYLPLATEELFFRIAFCSYQWWLEEYGNFTQRNEGEEFEK